jgi:Cu/Ag efflux pump CusA
MLIIRLLFYRVSAPGTHAVMVFGDQVKVWDEKIEAIEARIKLVLDYVGLEPSEGRERLPRDPPPRSIMDRCQMAWSDFKEFTHSAIHGAIMHALRSCDRTTLRWTF